MSTSTGTPRRQISPGRARAGLGLLLLPTAMVAIDINILFLALPAITVGLRASALDQLWIADIEQLSRLVDQDL
jgi:DHA2 family multidrug resistance protein-like MFS transporter